MSRLPEGWKTVLVKNLVTLTSGKFNPKKNLSEVESDSFKFPVYGGNGLTGYFTDFLIDYPTIIIGRVGEYCGSVHLENKPLWVTDNAIYIKQISNELLLDFLYRFFDYIGLENLAEKTGQPKITQEPIYNIQFVLPPLEEQKKIAEILSTVDEKIAFVDKAIEETQTLKKALMQKLLTEGIGHTEFKESELGRIPVEWEVVKLGDLTSLTAGGTPSTKIKSYWTPKEISWLSSGEVNKKIVFSTDNMISKEGLNNSAAKLVPKHSVLIGLAGQGKTRGTVAITEIDLTTNQSVASILPNDSIDMYFIYHNLDSRYEEIRSMSTGVGGRGGLNLSILKSINIALPPLEEQKEIATILNTADKKLETLREKKKSYEELKKGLMQKLLTGEIRV